MKIVMTGASGFVGSHLLRRWASAHEIFILPRNSEWKKILPGKADAVVHLAMVSGPFPDKALEMFEVNTLFTQRLLDYARQSGVKKFLFASTGDVYGVKAGASLESDPAKPSGYYAITKHLSELLMKGYSDFFETCSLRIYRPYGPGQKDRLIPKLAESIRKGIPVFVENGERPLLSPIYIDDLAEAFDRVLNRSCSGILNLAGSQIVSMKELIERIGEAVGSKPKIEEASHPSGDQIGDITLMKQKLGLWPMIGLPEGIKRTFTGKGVYANTHG